MTESGWTQLAWTEEEACEDLAPAKPWQHGLRQERAAARLPHTSEEQSTARKARVEACLGPAASASVSLPAQLWGNGIAVYVQTQNKL